MADNFSKVQTITGFTIFLFMVALSVVAHAGSQELAATGAAGSAFDAAPFGIKLDRAGGKSFGIRWAEPRKIRRVVVEFGDREELPAAENVRLQYWHRHWDGRPDPILAEAGAGRGGWARMDDWTNGRWRDADTQLDADGRRWTFTFNPAGAKEFKNLGPAGIRYRKTLKIRLFSNKQLPQVKSFRTLTDAVYRPLKVRILFGKPSESGIRIEGDDSGHLEIFNGSIVTARTIGPTEVAAENNAPWRLPAGAEGGIEADLMMAVDPYDIRYDRTIVTVRSGHRPFSFAADEVARGDRILVDDLGVLVVRGDDGITLTEYREASREFPGKTVYQSVFRESEQTLMRTWNDMPLKRPLYFIHGLPGNRNAMRQYADGNLMITSIPRWFNQFRSRKDSERKLWKGQLLGLGFGFPGNDKRGGRELLEGYLPQLRTWWQDGPVYYEQITILDNLDGKLDDVQLDDPTLLLMRVRVANTSDMQSGAAKLSITSSQQGGNEELSFQDGRVSAASGDEKRLRCLMRTDGKGIISTADKAIRWSLELAPGESHNLYFLIPSITLTADEEIDALKGRDFFADCRRVCEFWRKLTARGAQIRTTEPWIDDFYKAHLRHLMVNCYKEIGSKRLHAHVGTFRYGVFPNESAMMISDLDRRGYHSEAEWNLESYLHYQGTVSMPGKFKTKEGVFYGAAGAESGGYNKSHRYILWLMAEHWWLTRDRKWMERAVPKLIKGCEWVIGERQATMRKNEDGTRPIEYGFLPSGSLEDVTDYWYWLSTNSATVWGFRGLADALADYGHPRGREMQQEAKAFYDDFMRGITESRIRAPVVRLRDGTYVPKIPSRLYERGRCYGWLRETLEGSIFLPVYKLLDPKGPETKWIMQDFEDNLYIVAPYGYAIPVFDDFWFTRGGFSMQANLLDGPLPYLYRDEIKHYV
ncbi:MAG: hypothetical protein JSV03_03075, partial [Planctomycetota bacterium]